MHSNRHPADALADVREQIKALETREAELRAILLDGSCGLAGDEYIACVKLVPSTRLNPDALRRHFGAAALAPFTIKTEVTHVRLNPRKGNGRV